MKFVSWFTHLALFTLLVSCSHAPERKVQYDLTAEQHEQLNRDALAIASDRLEKMVVQAKTDQQMVNYLSTDLFLKANMSLLEGDYTTAAVLFRHLSELVPEDKFVQKKFAISLIRSGDLEGAVVVLEKLYKTGKEDKVGLILAGVYSGLDNEPKARKVYQEILADNPRNEDACIFLSKSYAMGKETTKAIGQLQMCAKMNPGNGMYDYYLGKVFIDQGQMPKAIESFKRSYQKQPGLSATVTALGMIYEEREEYGKAIDLYGSHLKKNPMDSNILSRMVQVLFVKERYEEVIPYAERLSDIEPENLNLKVKLGILYTDAKRYPEALSVFKDLLSVAPQSDKILYYIGAIYQEMRSFSESIEFFNQIPTDSGLYSDSSVQVANMLSTLAQDEYLNDRGNTQWKEAFLRHVNSRLEDLKDMRVEFTVIKSGFYESVGMTKEAMEAMMVVQNEKNFSVQHKYYLANLYEKQKKFEESTAVIMGILESDPKNAHAWNFLGYALLERGQDMDKAYQYIKTALEISPEDGYIRDSLGWYYYKQGDFKRALTELQAALKKVPDDIEILKHLAEIHREMRDFARARAYLETALKNARYQNERQEIMATMEELENVRLPASGKAD